MQTRADVTVNFNLKPGGLVETVTVSATAVTLQFNTTTRELTVDRKMLMDLPVKARNPFTLALLDPRFVSYGVVTADEAGVGRGLVKTDRNNFAPRLGIAWRLGECLAVGLEACGG